jgi:hypothetical protein
MVAMQSRWLEVGRTVSGLARLFEELQSRKVGLVSLRMGSI